MVPFLKGVQCTERARCVGPHRHRVPRPHIVLPHERRTSNTGYTGHRSRDSALQAPLRVHTREGRLSSLYCVRATTYRKPATGFLVGSSFALPPGPGPPTQRTADSGCAPARAPPKAQQPFNIIMPSRPGSRSSTYICSRPAPPRVPPCSLALTGRRASSCREIACCGEGEVFDSRMGEQHAACAHLLYTLR
jgi:hypothetical protein